MGNKTFLFLILSIVLLLLANYSIAQDNEDKIPVAPVSVSLVCAAYENLHYFMVDESDTEYSESFAQSLNLVLTGECGVNPNGFMAFVPLPMEIVKENVPNSDGDLGVFVLAIVNGYPGYIPMSNEVREQIEIAYEKHKSSNSI
jgi:hypothetical protein